MFGKQSVATKSINCGAGAVLADKIGISTLASKLTSLLSSLIGGFSTVFYLIFSYLMNQTQLQLSSSISSAELADINIISSDSYTVKLGELASFLTENNDTVNHKVSVIQSKKQIKFVNGGLFFCALPSWIVKIALRIGGKCENVEEGEVLKHGKKKYSSTRKEKMAFQICF